MNCFSKSQRQLAFSSLVSSVQDFRLHPLPASAIPDEQVAALQDSRSFYILQNLKATWSSGIAEAGRGEKAICPTGTGGR